MKKKKKKKKTLRYQRRVFFFFFFFFLMHGKAQERQGGLARLQFKFCHSRHKVPFVRQSIKKERKKGPSTARPKSLDSHEDTTAYMVWVCRRWGSRSRCCELCKLVQYIGLTLLRNKPRQHVRQGHRSQGLMVHWRPRTAHWDLAVDNWLGGRGIDLAWTGLGRRPHRVRVQHLMSCAAPEVLLDRLPFTSTAVGGHTAAGPVRNGVGPRPLHGHAGDLARRRRQGTCRHSRGANSWLQCGLGVDPTRRLFIVPPCTLR
eukprot:NODE_1670_length_1097_cov_50.463740_g129_i12.p1 GENE.NODE_1670_length_1097_cov_50.463740_g129_i12~~NODE_1670_length_1097_cov_50.463740_g129_i12.p1  ORF type:complete len:259 (+),score=41.89 NODE_1670_length_1097_cov_50.463740_g129_i12:317-1093(+)